MCRPLVPSTRPSTKRAIHRGSKQKQKEYTNYLLFVFLSPSFHSPLPPPSTYIHTYIHTDIFFRTLIEKGRWPISSQRGGFFIACSQLWGLSARFGTTTRSTEGGKSRVWSGKRPPRWVAGRWRRAVTWEVWAYTVPEDSSFSLISCLKPQAADEYACSFSSIIMLCLEYGRHYIL